VPASSGWRKRPYSSRTGPDDLWQQRVRRPGQGTHGRLPGLQTLYQSEYRKDVFGPPPVLENGDVPVEVNVKGFTVRIWVEKGLLFALTEEAALEPIDPGE